MDIQRALRINCWGVSRRGATHPAASARFASRSRAPVQTKAGAVASRAVANTCTLAPLSTHPTHQPTLRFPSSTAHPVLARMMCPLFAR